MPTQHPFTLHHVDADRIAELTLIGIAVKVHEADIVRLIEVRCGEEPFAVVELHMPDEPATVAGLSPRVHRLLNSRHEQNNLCRYVKHQVKANHAGQTLLRHLEAPVA